MIYEGSGFKELINVQLYILDNEVTKFLKKEKLT